MDLVDLRVIPNSKIQTKTTGVLTLNHHIVHETARQVSHGNSHKML